MDVSHGECSQQGWDTMVIAHIALGELGGWPKLFAEISLGTKRSLL